MFDDVVPKQPGLIRRLSYTPLGDALRGRITGKHDLPWKFESSLPKPLAKHLLRIARHGGLSINEQIAASDELIAECSAALDAGTSVEQLIEDHPRKTTRRTILKRYRAKRGWIGRNAHHLWWTPVILAGLYLLAVVYFFFSRPTLNVDYLAMLNEPALAVPEEDRAWPGYREAILAMRLQPTNSRDETYPIDDGMAPTYPRWPEARNWLIAHRDELNALRDAADKPGMGLTVGYSGHYTGDDALAIWGPSENDPNQPRQDEIKRWDNLYNPMTGVMYPQAGINRRLSRILIADAYLALEERDGERFVANRIA